MDIDSILVGVDFHEHIRSEIKDDFLCRGDRGMNHPPRTLDELLTRPPFYAPSAFKLEAFAAQSLLQLTRIPHRYGFAFSCLGSAPHLIKFDTEGQFNSLMRGDGFDRSDPTLAATRSVFEMLERVWSALAPPERLTSGSYSQLGARALDPRSFALLSAEELASTNSRYVPYSGDLMLDWIEAQRIECSRPMTKVLVPALFVFPGFGIRFPRQRFVPMLSTGLAAGVRYDAALLNAICEVVERDAFAIAWLLRLAPPRIEIVADMLPTAAHEIVQTLRADGFLVGFFDLTRDIELPVALAAIQSTEDGRAVVLGLGCHPCPNEALSKALREAMVFMTIFYDFPGGIGLARKTDAAGWSPGRMEALNSLLSSTDVSPRMWKDGADEDTLASQMPRLALRAIDALAQAGHDIYICDLTPAIIDGELSFVLLRALIPSLQPHLYEADCWRLASPRLAAVTGQLGWQTEDPTPARLQRELNPFAWHTA